MPINSDSFRFSCSKSLHSMVGLILLNLIVLSFVSCSESGNETGPLVSSLSPPTEETASVGTEEGDQNQSTDATENEAQDSEELANIPDPDEQEAPETLSPPISTGVTTQLTWEASTDPNVLGYFVHYGKQSPGEYGSCSYEQSQRVGPPPATITDLEPNTPYFFAISAFGESESESDTPCSNEIIVVTPATPQT